MEGLRHVRALLAQFLPPHRIIAITTITRYTRPRSCTSDRGRSVALEGIDYSLKRRKSIGVNASRRESIFGVNNRVKAVLK